jgi:predicted nucleic acid-binding Zn ribbon protein
VKRSHPTRLSALLEKTLARFGLDRRLDDYRIWQAWDEVVGRTISRNAQPVRLDGDRLVVTVKSSTWLQELTLLQGELLSRLNEWMGREVVTELYFVVGRVEHHVPEAVAKTVKPSRDAPASRVAEGGPAQKMPAVPGLSIEATAAFDRLWKAARARQQERPD